MTQPCCLFVGQALQMPHWYGLCQLVLCLVHTLVDILGDRVALTTDEVPTIQSQVCLDTAQAAYLVIGGLAQPDHSANGVTDIRLATPGRTIDQSISHHGKVVVDQLRPFDIQ